MRKWAALLRGVNVGGKNKLPMQDLRDTAMGLGWTNVKTYIQSGNMAFEADAPKPQDLGEEIERRFGFRPFVLLVSLKQFEVIKSDCPYASETGKDVHIYFLEEPSSADRAKLDTLKSGREEWFLTEQAFYLYAPDGIGRSKLAAGAEKALGVRATARNWNSIEALSAMLEGQ